MTRRRRPPQPQGVIAARWTVPRATLVGLLSGLSALILAGVMNSERLLRLDAALLGLTAFCGLSILLITIRDIKTRGRGGRVRPIRAFDVIMGVALLAPAAYGLWLVWPLLGL